MTSPARVASRYLKRAGKFSVPLFSKHKVLVTAREIQAAILKEGGFDREFVGNLDFKNVEWVKGTDKADYMVPPGVMVTWRVYPKGEFGNRDSDYVWGYVYVGAMATSKGIEAAGTITVSV